MNMKKIGLGSIAAAGAVALVMGLGTPAMATVSPTLGSVVVSGPSSVTLGAKDIPLSFVFNGPAAANQYSYGVVSADASLIGYNTKIRSSYLKKLQGVYNGNYDQTISPTAANSAKWSLYNMSTTPGKWRVPITVKYYSSGATATGYKDISVNASKSTSKKATSLSGYGRANKPFPLTVRAPYYQVGAKVRVYYKAAGKKKYKKVATGYLKSDDAYNSKVKIKIKSSKLTRKGSLYVKISSRPYAPGYNSVVGKFRRY